MATKTTPTHSNSIRRRLRPIRHLLPLLVVFGLLLGLVPPVAAAELDVSRLEPSLAAAITKNPRKKFQVIVQAEPANTKAKRKDGLDKVAKALRERDSDGEQGKIRAQLGLVNGFAAELKGNQIAKLSKNKAIKSISGDHKVKLLEAEPTPTPPALPASPTPEPTATTPATATPPPTATTLATATPPPTAIPASPTPEPTTAPGGAPLASMQTIVAHGPEVWATGDQGQGITVAVLDSGILPNPDLPSAFHGIDIATNTTALGDPGGHGTHVAGIIAGNGSMLSGKWKGAAPQTRVLSVKVTSDTGNASYSSIIKGLQWVVANRHAQNIRVVNLSLGATPVVSYKDDPLAAAAELVWFSGVVVVVSAGNGGEDGQGTITVPATDPYVISVGATNQHDTSDISDDNVTTWSSRGPTAYDNLPKPDVVAGGNRVISIRSPGSYIEQLLGLNRVVDDHYYRISGTSMSAPVVSGVAALILAANPALTPNQVKHIIKTTTRQVGTTSVNRQGAGQVDANAAVALAISGAPIPQANTNQRPSNVFARSIYTLAQGAPVSWRDPNYLGQNWNNWSWEGGTWDGAAWDNLIWENIDWINASWSGASWDSLTGWNGGSWDGGTWDGGTWDGGSWDGGSWDGGTWDGGTWDGGTWDGGTWDGGNWDAAAHD